MMACTSSIGPGATNMVTAAAVAHANRLPLLLLPGDVFASRRPDPVLQQIQGFGDPTVSVNDCFRPFSRWWDRITRPEQILESLPQALRVLTDPPMGADVPRPRSEEVRFAHDSALERGGFEPSGPEQIRSLFETTRLVSPWRFDGLLTRNRSSNPPPSSGQSPTNRAAAGTAAGADRPREPEAAGSC
jgi:hypothetical protein